MKAKSTPKAILIAAALAAAATLQILPGFCQGYEGTDPQTGLNTQEQAWQADSRVAELRAQMQAMLTNTNPADNASIFTIMGAMFEYLVARMNEPATTGPAAASAGQAQANAGANAAGDVARDQAITAIDYASRFLKNFTTEKGNKWNNLRDSVFVPIALLLILPGAVLTQLKAIVAQGSPVVAQCNPFEGIQRAIVAIFLIPGTYLIVNYGIDFANSIQFTIATEYNRLFGSNMYKDAICAEIRAFGVRYLSENDGSLNTPPADLAASSNGEFSAAEARLWGKLVDPCTGLNRVPRNRDDASMPASSIAARLMLNASNAGINTGWSILCAFQMAFFYYLYFIGPIMAALWVWPMKQLRDAFPSWVEGVVTLCFWSLFWHTTILLMACFKGTDETGLFVMSALNFLATACVKNAFDFAGLVRAAGQKASEIIEKGNKQGGGGGGGAGGGGNEQNAGQQGGQNTQFVNQEMVPSLVSQGSTPLYQDANADGLVDGVWNSQQGEYNAVPDGQSLFLVSASNTPGLISPPNIEMPPAMEGAPPVMVTQDDKLAFFNPATNQYEVQQVMNTNTGEMVAQYIVDDAGRIAVFDGTGYVVVQTFDPQSNTNVDTYRIQHGALEVWNPTTGYTTVQANTQEAVVPPIFDATPATFQRNSLGSLIGDAFFPIMHYPISAKLKDADEVADAVSAQQNQIEIQTEEDKIISFDVQPPQSATPHMEIVSNMMKEYQNNKDQLRVSPPPLSFSPSEPPIQPAPSVQPVQPVQPIQPASPVQATQPIQAQQTQTKTSLEAEIEKLFSNLSAHSNPPGNGLFVEHTNTQVQSIAPRSAEELLNTKDRNEPNAISRALGRTFTTANETHNQTEGLW